jgi:hypothetical protein
VSAFTDSPLDFDRVVALTSEPGNQAFFGRNVLRGLVEGIEDFRLRRQDRWWRPGGRTIGPAMLACSPWVGDEDLLAVVEKLKAACIVMTKIGFNSKLREALEQINEGRLPGFPLAALPALALHQPRGPYGSPRVVGPYDGLRGQDHWVPTIRSFGFRQSRKRAPPIAHAKLALLGELWWHDEDAFGNPDDITGFTPRRLWVSSANFTQPSRSSLEFGFWTEDADLLTGTEGFLEQLVGESEALDAVADEPYPEFVEVEFDDEAMADAYAEMVVEEELDRSSQEDDHREG